MNKKWVIKIGSALLTNSGQGLDMTAITGWVEQIVKLKDSNIDVIIVSSGSIIEGMWRLGWSSKPSDISKLQVAAAVGQMGLIQAYESIFAKFNTRTAQILLTHDNLQSGKRYQNICATFNNLLHLGVVPVVNENDTVAVEEIKFGDNDVLAALVANLVVAERLVILTDQNGIYDSDPRHNATAKIISKIHVDDKRLLKIAGKSGSLFGSGGMYTKVLAAKKARNTNTITYIVSGKEVEVLIRLKNCEHVGSLIYC